MKACSFFFLALLGAAHCDPYVTWNGTNITTPILIFHDELLLSTGPETVGDPNRPGALVCRSDDSAQASWHFPAGTLVDDFTESRSSYFQQIRTGDMEIPSLSRLLRTSNDPLFSVSASGSWICRVDGNTRNQIRVGLYYRGSQVQVRRAISLRLSEGIEFLNDPPSFELSIFTDGGPPDNSWMRNTQPLSNNGDSIVIFSNFIAGALYSNRIQVTGRLPGVYHYSVTNRATVGAQNDSFNIEGESPTNLAARELLPGIVEVTWTEPPAPPQIGYRVTVDSSNTSIASSSPHFLSQLPLGAHSIQVQAMSQHFPSDVIGPVDIMVTGTLMLNVSVVAVTATTVNLTWTQPAFSVPVQYVISVTPLSSQCTLDSVESAPVESSTSDYAAASVTGLQEFSDYTAAVTVGHDSSSFTLGDVQFTTLSSVPSSPPQQANAAVTARSFTASWNQIDCTERNGLITGYKAELQQVGGATVISSVVGRIFSANGLIPDTRYSFRVAGVTINGTGPFSRAISMRTGEDVPGPVSNLVSQVRYVTVLIFWSRPSEPNGAIISYEISYRINGSNLVVTNTTEASTGYTISSLTPQTTVSDISVRAYTAVGPGKLTSTSDVVLSNPPLVSDVLAEVLTSTSVLVSWSSETQSSNGYAVYYRPTQGEGSEEEMVVAIFSSPITISGLMNGVEYQFQVAAMADDIGNEIVVGERSILDERSIITVSQGRTSDVPSQYVVAALTLSAVAILIMIVLVLIVLARFFSHGRVATKSPDVELQQNEAYSAVQIVPR